MTTAAEKLARLVLLNTNDNAVTGWHPIVRALAREVLDDAAKGNAKVIKRTVAQPDPEGPFVAGHRFRADGTEMVWGQMPYAGRHYFALRVGTGLQRVRRVTPKAIEAVTSPGRESPTSDQCRQSKVLRGGPDPTFGASQLHGGPGPHAATLEWLTRTVKDHTARLDALEAKADRKVPRY